jgi:small GTP-binding protein
METTERRLKATLVGDGGVGKSCLLQTYIEGNFPEEYVPTALDPTVVTLLINGENVNLELIDINAYAEEYDRVKPYVWPFNGTDIYLFCFSLAGEVSLKNLTSIWLPKVQQYDKNPKIVLIGMKSDLQQSVEEDQIKTVSKKIKALGYYTCSSKMSKGGRNLQMIFEKVIVHASHSNDKNCTLC